MIGGFCIGVATADLQLQPARELKAHLTEGGDGRGRIGPLQAVFGGWVSGRRADQKIVVRYESQFVVVCIGTEDPVKKALVVRYDVEVLRPERLPAIVGKVAVANVGAVQIGLVLRVALLITRD